MILLFILFDPSQIINLDTTSRQQVPAIAAYENYLHVVWEDERDPSANFDIYCRTSTDCGQTFDYETRVNQQQSKNQRNPDLVVYNGIIYAVFEDYQSYYDIAFTKSTDHGQNFTPSITVNDTTKYSQRYPRIGVDGCGIIYIIWYDSHRNKDIFCCHSDNGGNSFSASVLVNSLLADTFPQYQPDIAVDYHNRVFVCFIDSATSSIYVSRSTDYGQTFDHIAKVNSCTDSIRGDPEIEVDNNDYVFVVWEDKRTGEYDIYIARSTNHGNSFETEIKVNDATSRNQRSPDIAVLNDDIYVLWEDYRSNNYDIYISKSTDHGTTFMNSIRVNDYTQKSQRYPSIATSGRCHICWEDYRYTSADIYATGGVVEVGEEKKTVQDKITSNPSKCSFQNAVIYDALGRKVNRINRPGIFFIKGKLDIKVIVVK